MTPWLDDGDVRLYHGDALEQLSGMPSESVHCAITSPPFYSLRDYGVDGQIGLEDTLGEWLTSLVAVFRELKRVLRSDGTFWLEIGDSYADKQLAGAPWRLAFALQKAGWYLRSDTIWSRPNPMPESVTDRPTKAHSYVFLLTKNARYYYDADAIREPDAGLASGNGFNGRQGGSRQTAVDGGEGTAERFTPGAGRNVRSVWSIPTEPTPFAHFATFPQTLVERCIKAGTSEHGACSECGAPWRRITDATPSTNGRVGGDANWFKQQEAHNPSARAGGFYDAKRYHLGWEPSCGHGRDHAAVPCVVLDPFMGSGTTALVARRLGRHAIGVELNLDYLRISADRLSQLSLLTGDAS